MELIQFTRSISLRDSSLGNTLLQAIQPSSNEAKFFYLDECLFWSLKRNQLVEANHFANQIIENRTIFQPWIREHSKRLYQHFRICRAKLPLQMDCRFAKSIVQTLKTLYPDACIVEKDEDQCFLTDVYFVEDEKEHEALFYKQNFPFSKFVHVNWFSVNPFLMCDYRMDMFSKEPVIMMQSKLASLLHLSPPFFEIRLSEQLDTSLGESELLCSKVPFVTKFKNLTFVMKVKEIGNKSDDIMLQMDCYMIIFASFSILSSVMARRRGFYDKTLILLLPADSKNPFRSHNETLKTLFEKGRRPERLQPHQSVSILFEQTEKYLCLKEAAILNPFGSENMYWMEKECTIPLPLLSMHKKLFLNKFKPIPFNPRGVNGTVTKQKEDPFSVISCSQVYVSTTFFGGPLSEVSWLVNQVEKRFIQGIYQYQRPLLDDTILSILLYSHPQRFV